MSDDEISMGDLSQEERDLMSKAVRIMTASRHPDGKKQLLHEVFNGDFVGTMRGLVLLCDLLTGMRERETGIAKEHTLQQLGVALATLDPS